MDSVDKAIIVLLIGFVLYFIPGCYLFSLLVMTIGGIEVIFND